MNPIAENIKQRLSLRQPLKEALDILVQLSDELEMEKEVDLKAELEKVKSLFSTCTDFEREFPSICFSIATGVGKTRLMGACVAYLYLHHGIKNFFVLAPNLTIYEKLIEDFDNATKPKYVFTGISELVHNKPVIITGDNYNQVSSLFSETEIRINIFNVSKFNSENRGTNRAGVRQPPRIKRLSEYIGQSYWSYLSNLNDLVILMDEAHRYHADASRNAINELKPILGIEMTATPIAEDGSQFRNVVYEYSLAKALDEGLYVKNPTIATRRDFEPIGKSEEEIEKMKLEDSISIHEDTKNELEIYSKNTGNKKVKPLLLIAAKNTTHAKDLFDFINSKDFFKGEYTDKVLRVDSTNANDEEVESLFVSLESADNPIEIVIHVFKLKEGWDVSNLYTICPLNAANSIVLIEQTIGRGLRLPYNGERTGVEKVDKLTVVAHDNFKKVILAAQDPNSILNKFSMVEIDESDLAAPSVVVTAPNTFTHQLQKEQEAVSEIKDEKQKQKQQNVVDAKKILVNLIPTFNNNAAVKKVEDLNKPEVKAQVMAAVEKELNTGQLNVFAPQIAAEAEVIYEKFVSDFKNNIISIPRMDLVQGAVTASFDDFDLDSSAVEDFNSFKTFQPLAEEIVVIGIGVGNNSYDTIPVQAGINYGTPSKLLISELINYSEVDYDSNADLLQKLSKQCVAEIEKNLKVENKDEIRKTIFQWRKIIAERIYKQMMNHFHLHEPDYSKPKVMSFTKIEAWNFTALKIAGYKDYREEKFPASAIQKYVFRGFEKACHFEYKFDSVTELFFGFVCETDKNVLKWMRPADNQFRLWWNHNTSLYRPDFVAETKDAIYLIETKRKDELTKREVTEKMKAAMKYCRYATEFTKENKGKPWHYVLVPHDQVAKNKSFAGIISPNIKTE